MTSACQEIWEVIGVIDSMTERQNDSPYKVFYYRNKRSKVKVSDLILIIKTACQDIYISICEAVDVNSFYGK